METLPRIFTKFLLENIIDPNTAIIELNKSVFYPDDQLYDGAFYTIKRINNTFETEATLYLFSDESSKNQGSEPEEHQCNLVVTKDMVHCLNFIWKYYFNRNPETPFDSIFITVQRDGRYIVNYEYQNEEVQPQFKLKEEYTFSEYGESWYNCISYNAPDDFEWIWMILERKDKDIIGGEFFYSMNKDQSDPISLKPGEYIYMYNITSTIIDKFYKNISDNWKKVFVGYDNDKLHIGIMEKFS